MKKLFIALCMLLVLTACANTSAPQEPISQEPVEEEVAGGWTINSSIKAIEADVYFEKAISKYDGMGLTPLFVLGSQPTPNNYAYLCYGTTVTANPTTDFKVVIIAAGENSEDTAILNVADFNLKDYLDSKGSNTPEGLMGGWQDNGELENVLHDKTNTMFNRALNGITGVAYTPVCVLGTQVVAGTNYAVLAVGKSVTAQPIPHLYVINIYEDLQGNATVNNICGIDLSSFNK